MKPANSDRHSHVRGIILAGVHAWGESVLERVCPRPLLPLAGRPLAWYGLDWLRRGGVQDIVVCANSDTRAMKSCLGTGKELGVRLHYYEDVMPRGPAGCIRDASSGCAADTLVIVQGTVLPRVNLERLLQAHERSGSALTMVAMERGSAADGSQTLEPAGIYVISRLALELVPPQGYQDIKEMWIPRLYARGQVCRPYAVPADAAIGVMGAAGYLRAVGAVLERMASDAELTAGYRRLGSAWVHKSARVASSVHISGPVLIGPGAWVNRFVGLVGPTIIGPDARIGSAAILNHVVAWSACEVGKSAIVNRCILPTGSLIERESVARHTVFRGRPARNASGVCTPAEYWAMRSIGKTTPTLRGPMPTTTPLAGVTERN